MSRSVVSGARVIAAPEKMVRPRRSPGRPATNSLTTCLATVSRSFGLKSSAPMLPETSSTIWMSIPSVRLSSQA